MLLCRLSFGVSHACQTLLTNLSKKSGHIFVILHHCIPTFPCQDEQLAVGQSSNRGCSRLPSQEANLSKERALRILKKTRVLNRLYTDINTSFATHTVAPVANTKYLVNICKMYFFVSIPLVFFEDPRVPSDEKEHLRRNRAPTQDQVSSESNLRN